MGQSELLLKRLKELECSDSTYPSTDPGLVFDRALGSLIRDVDGREYIDLCGGFGALPFGHNPEVLKSVFRQYQEELPPIEHGMGDVYPSAAKVRLLEELNRATPTHLTTFALGLTGSHAVEIAVKSALLRAGGGGFLALEGGYHGVDLGVVSLSTRPEFGAPFKPWNAGNNVRLIRPGCGEAEIQSAIDELKKFGGFAGAIVEPIQGRGGVLPVDTEWLKVLGELCRHNSGLFILDEVFCGMGRCGKVTIAEVVGADITCFGKALGGGFPVSACAGTKDAFSGWPESTGEAIHTGTFFGHPFHSQIATAVLQKICEEGWPDRNTERGKKINQMVVAHLEDCAHVKEVRAIGMMFGIELTQPGMAATLMDRLRARGVLVLPSGPAGNVLSLSPAFDIEDRVIERGIDLITQELRGI